MHGTVDDLAQQLSEAKATIHALLSGQVDAVVDPASQTPLLLYTAQAALRMSEERYRQIVDATADGIIKMDDALRTEFVNGQFAEMLGYDIQAIVGKQITGFMSGAMSEVLVGELKTRQR